MSTRTATLALATRLAPLAVFALTYACSSPPPPASDATPDAGTLSAPPLETPVPQDPSETAPVDGTTGGTDTSTPADDAGAPAPSPSDAGTTPTDAAAPPAPKPDSGSRPPRPGTTCPAGAQQASEPNDDLGAENALVPGNVCGEIGGGDDADYFKITFPAGSSTGWSYDVKPAATLEYTEGDGVVHFKVTPVAGQRAQYVLTFVAK